MGSEGECLSLNMRLHSPLLLGVLRGLAPVLSSAATLASGSLRRLGRGPLVVVVELEVATSNEERQIAHTEPYAALELRRLAPETAQLRCRRRRVDAPLPRLLV